MKAPLWEGVPLGVLSEHLLPKSRKGCRLTPVTGCFRELQCELLSPTGLGMTRPPKLLYAVEEVSWNGHLKGHPSSSRF